MRLVERTTNALVTKDDGALEEVKKALIQASRPNIKILLLFLFSATSVRSLAWALLRIIDIADCHLRCTQVLAC